MAKLDEVRQAVETGRSKLVEGLVNEVLAEGTDPLKVLSEMIAAMGVVGDRFQRAEIFVPEMLVAARTMKKGMDILKPKLGNDAGVSLGKAIVGTVHGDLHDIGKNLVSLMLESTGFEVFDLGVDVSVEKFQECLKENPDTKIVALSCLLTTTMPSMTETAAILKQSGGKFKLIVGGAPITQEFADQVGADGFATDAAGAANLAKKLVS